MMSKKTLMVLAFACILLGCGKNSSKSDVVTPPENEVEKQVYKAMLNERRQVRESSQERIARLKEELASEREKDATSERVKILEAELQQWEKEAEQQRAETYRLVRERAKKAQKQIQKDGGK